MGHVWDLELSNVCNRRMWEREKHQPDLEDEGPCHPDFPPELSAEETRLCQGVETVHPPRDRLYTLAPERERNSAARHEQAARDAAPPPQPREGPRRATLRVKPPTGPLGPRHLDSRLQPGEQDAPPMASGRARPLDPRLHHTLENGRCVTDLVNMSSNDEREVGDEIKGGNAGQEGTGRSRTSPPRSRRRPADEPTRSEYEAGRSTTLPPGPRQPAAGAGARAETVGSYPSSANDVTPTG